MINHVKEILEKVKEIDQDSNWPELYGRHAQISKNIYIFGHHIEMFTFDDLGMITSKDVTRDFMSGKEE